MAKGDTHSVTITTTYGVESLTDKEINDELWERAQEAGFISVLEFVIENGFDPDSELVDILKEAT